MLITILGIRGTVPSETSGTVGLLVNGKYAFDVPPEFIQSMIKARVRWNKLLEEGRMPKEFRAYPAPNLGKIEHVFISHFHWDHWGGLAHYLRWLRLFHHDLRKERPLNIYIPKDSMIPFKRNMIETWSLNEEKIMSLPDHDFFYRFLSIELHESISDIVRFYTVEPEKPLYLDAGQLKVTCTETKHLPQGSVAYRIDACKEKVNLGKLQELGITPGPIIGKIKKSSEGIQVDGKLVRKEDILTFQCITACYSGDSAINYDMIKFYNNADVLIHDSAYLSSKEEYYLERHADLESLVEFSKKIVGLKALIPIHFSHRYGDAEIKEKIKELGKNSELPFNLILPNPRTFILIRDEGVLAI